MAHTSRFCGLQHVYNKLGFGMLIWLHQICCEFFPLRRFGDALFAPNYGCYDLIVDFIYFCNMSRIGFLSISPDVDSNKCYLDINKVKR